MTDMVDWAWNPVICLLPGCLDVTETLTRHETLFICPSSRVCRCDWQGWLGIRHCLSVYSSPDCPDLTNVVDLVLNTSSLFVLLQTAPLWLTWLTRHQTLLICRFFTRLPWFNHHGWLDVKHQWPVCSRLCHYDQCDWLGVEHQFSVWPPDCTTMTSVVE